MSYAWRLGSGGRLYRGAELQWQPTLTVHDPNPPITLEHLTASAVVMRALVVSWIAVCRASNW